MSSNNLTILNRNSSFQNNQRSQASKNLHSILSFNEIKVIALNSLIIIIVIISIIFLTFRTTKLFVFGKSTSRTNRRHFDGIPNSKYQDDNDEMGIWNRNDNKSSYCQNNGDTNSNSAIISFEPMQQSLLIKQQIFSNNRILTFVSKTKRNLIGNMFVFFYANKRKYIRQFRHTIELL